MGLGAPIASAFRSFERAGFLKTITHIRHGTNTGNSDGTVTRGADVETNITGYFATTNKDINGIAIPNTGTVIFRSALLTSAVRNNDQFRVNGQLWNITTIRDTDVADLYTIEIIRS